MKQLLLVLVLVSAHLASKAQFFTIPDTILIQTFTVDPSDTMLVFPNGNDNHWVNWDADNLSTFCGDSDPVPGNWYWESDLGDLSNPPVNFAFTSCSFLSNGLPNENWLITPPVFITDSTATLTWRSASFEGPGYMDGYKVLASTTTNEPFSGAFTDTLFVAAEMVEALVEGSLNVEDYIFSPGYIHADSYTNTDYFFLIHPSAQAYTGRLEPHTVSLAQFVGRSIYIAFLHDSRDDNILQIDDIAIVQDQSSGTATPSLRDLHLCVQPNPAANFATITWETRTRLPGQLTVTDIFGKTVLEQAVFNPFAGFAHLNLTTLPAGIYSCTLRTPEGRQSILMAKQ